MRGGAPALARLGFNRRAPVRSARAPFQEWLHFCVHTPTHRLVLNYSQRDEPAGAALRRVILIYGPDGVRGDVSRCADGGLRSGAFGLRFASDRVSLRGGRIHLEVTAPALGLALDVALEPVSEPSVTHNSRCGDAPPIHWVFVPHLRAHGAYTLDGVPAPVADAPAYHDHDWGHFGWGDDFSWTWIYAVPRAREDGWAAIAVQLMDRRRRRLRSQGVMLWRDHKLVRVWRDREVRFEAEHGPPERTLTVPGAAAMLVDGAASAAPRALVVEVAADGERLRLAFERRGLARIVVPDTVGDGVTVIHEADGEVSMRGHVRGQSIDTTAVGMMEVLGV